MIRLSKMTDYAFVALRAMDTDKMVSASDLALQTRVPEPTIAKVLKTLTKNGIVRSMRGANGGYSLEMSQAELSVGEIIEIFEGTIALTACLDDGQDSCALEGVCELNGKWAPLNRQIRDLFYAQRVSDLGRDNKTIELEKSEQRL